VPGSGFSSRGMHHIRGSSINNVTVVVGEGQLFCDSSTKAFVIKKRDDGGGAHKLS
jgi:hypothetical protein